MNTDSSTVALVGLPRTGKSTYLGALWDLIQDRRDQTIVEVDVSGDRGYLQTLGEQVARGDRVHRTAVASEEGLRLTVALNGTRRVHLDVPDLSGETLRVLVEDRIWHHRLSEAMKAADAVLLFVHPSLVRLPMRVNWTEAVLAEVDAAQRTEAETPAAGSEGAPAPPPDEGDVQADSVQAEPGDVDQARASEPKFAPRYACTAAKLVDALENLAYFRRASVPLRIGFVVSAWDTVEEGLQPEAWFADRLPGVMSLCASNPSEFSTEFFGVSAQGGRLPEQRDELLRKGDVFNRAYARDRDGVAVPLSHPLEWALSG